MKIFDIPQLNLKIYYGVTKEGFYYYFIPNKELSVYYATINVNYGAKVIEYKKGKEIRKIIPGTAHYLEHLMFNKENMDLFNEYARLGISPNATTSYDLTYFEIFGSKNFEKGLNLLLTEAFEPYFTEKLVDQERGIILEEEKSSRTNPYFKANELYKANIYKANTYKNSVCGSEKDILSIKRDNIMNTYEDFYHPKNMYIIISGNFDQNVAKSIVCEYLSKKDFSKDYDIKVKSFKEPKTVNKSKEEVSLKIQIPKIKIAYKYDFKLFKDYKEREFGAYSRMLFDANFGPISEFRNDLLKKGLIIGGISTSFRRCEDCVIAEFGVETNYPKEILDIIDKKFNNLEFSKKDLSLEKKMRLKGYILASDDAICFHDMYQGLLANDRKALYDYYEFTKSLSLEKINKMISILNKYSRTYMIINPEK